jgi:hypothetical protein
MTPKAIHTRLNNFAVNTSSLGNLGNANPINATAKTKHEPENHLFIWKTSFFANLFTCALS